MTRTADPESAIIGDLPTLFSPSLEGAVEGAAREAGSDEAAHLRTARVRPGDRLAVTDGRGARWSAELLGLDRRTARYRLGRPLPPSAPKPVELLAPVGRGDRSLWLVEKAVELGVETIAWVECERSRSVADAGRSAGFLDRARRRAIAALKQSGGAWIPRLAPPVPLADILGPPGRREGEDVVRWLGDAGGGPVRAAAEALGGAALRASILVGPEGGLTDEERADCLAAGYRPVRLGDRTLRFETAAIGLASVAVARLEGSERDG